MRKKGRGIKGKLALTAVAIAAASLVVGCMQQGATESDVSTEETQYANSYEEAEAILAQRNARQDEINKEYAPEIRTLEDGTKVQRTPTEYQCYHWNRPYEGGTSYNTYYMDADNRGCGACHEDLKDTLSNMEYQHVTVWNDALGNWLTADQCQLCHSDDDGYEFGTLMHAVHYGERNGQSFEDRGGKCISCHNMTENGEGFELWDQVKYDHLDGIVKEKNVQGEFQFDQTTKVSKDEMFTYDWIHSDYDHLISIMGKHGINEPLPQEMVDNWEITIDGLVNKPYTAKLKDLIAEAEAEGASVTKLSKIHCLDNMPGGGGISNVEITGIPLNWLIERGGGMKDGVTGVIVDRREFHTNGVQNHSTRGTGTDKFGDVYLVYKIDGRPLDISSGSPCINWIEANDAQGNVKQCVGYKITDEDKDWDAISENGFDSYDEGPYMNKPNVTALKVPEGKIIKTGEPFTFEGYADAFDEAVTKIEFSMDNGKTWTAFDLGQTDPRQWVYWHFTWTPETDGSYVLMLRGTTESGLVTDDQYIQKVMVTAKSNFEE
ncbi:molybdopterin-dependent oxidoreductase [Slackia isoflavoniconvertens]|uniref:molybdopterin-dependent oxidoreductase n=1 Tax=Slackia isoflavoniconvertens TaxID=572010 RepID=UPI002E772A3B|nr:molybdopterin-dependent oxidoreductase [Slackia isoflavoniconvertens]